MTCWMKSSSWSLRRLDIGKTSLLVDFASQVDLPVCWYAVEELDQSPERFFSYFIAALQRQFPEFGEISNAAVKALNQFNPDIDQLVSVIVNDAYEHIREHFLVVLDDYHAVDSQPVDNALTFLLDHLPPQMHLVIATREDPHLPLARLRARGQLTELRAADLRFTPAEGAEFLNQVMGLDLCAETSRAGSAHRRLDRRLTTGSPLHAQKGFPIYADVGRFR
jgi:LuxR family maltose regulon positive regulatory protein